MAKSHSTNGVYTNPEVRFERSDIDLGPIVRFGVILAVVLVISSALALWLAWYVTQAESRTKKTTLPPAAADSESRGAMKVPEPRLEAIEDVEAKGKKDWQIYPDRSTDYYAGQRELLRDGDKAKGVLPIGSALADLAGKLPARKDAPPAHYGIALPSKAASGRASTGAQ